MMNAPLRQRRSASFTSGPITSDNGARTRAIGDLSESARTRRDDARRVQRFMLFISCTRRNKSTNGTVSAAITAEGTESSRRDEEKCARRSAVKTGSGT